MAKSGITTRRPQAARVYQSLDIQDLSGGMDRRRSPTLVQSDRARKQRNVSLGSPGEWAVRPGYVRFSTTDLGSTGWQGGQRIYLASTTFSLAAFQGAVYRPPDGGGASSDVEYSTVNSTAAVYFPYDRVLVAVMDGHNRPAKSTGSTTWTRMGIDAPTAKSTASSVTGGSLSASEFEFTFSYKDRGTAHESNISTLVSTVTLASTGAVELQCANSSDAQVDALIAWGRNKTAGESVLRRISSFAAQVGAHSTVTVTSSAWSANDEAPTNHNPPDAYAFAVPWKNRWWAKDAAVGNRVHFTEIFQNQSWPILFYIDIPFERGDSITALVPQGDTLLVFGQSKVYLIIGQTSLDFEVKPSAGAQAGCLGPKAWCVVENGVIHISAEGVFIFDGATDKYLSFDIETDWRDMIRTSGSAALSQIEAVYSFNYKEVRISAPNMPLLGARGEWILDLNRTRESETPTWSYTDRTIGNYLLWDGDEPTAGHRGRLLSLDPANGRIFEESTGTTANSSNLTAEYEGPHLATGQHLARFIDLYGEYEPNDGVLGAETFVDGVSQGARSFAIGGNLAQYGTALYGTAAYAGSGRKRFYDPLPIGAEGRTVWQTFTYTGKKAFRLFTYGLGMVPESKPRGFSD